MLKNKLFVSLFIVVFSYSPIALSLVTQEEEFFSEPVQELTDKVGDVPVYSHIYGANFMTEQERCNYLLELDSKKTKEERDAFRAKHRERIDYLRKEARGG
jgi:hypothetical protein